MIVEKFGDYKSTRSGAIRLPHFVTNNDDDAARLTGVLPKNRVDIESKFGKLRSRLVNSYQTEGISPLKIRRKKNGRTQISWLSLRGVTCCLLTQLRLIEPVSLSEVNNVSSSHAANIKNIFF